MLKWDSLGRWDRQTGGDKFFNIKRLSSKVRMKQSSEELQKDRPKVIVAIPCFNTECFVAALVSETNKYVDQVIVIDHQV